MDKQVFELRMQQLLAVRALLDEIADSKAILALNEEMDDPLGQAEFGISALIGALREAGHE